MSSWLLILTFYSFDGVSVTSAYVPNKESCLLAQRTFINRKNEQSAFTVYKDALCIELKKEGVK